MTCKNVILDILLWRPERTSLPAVITQILNIIVENYVSNEKNNY